MDNINNDNKITTKNEYITITLPVECAMAFMVAGNNYIRRIKQLEEQNRISLYKLKRIKDTNIYDLKKGMEIIKSSLNNKQ